MYGDHKIIFLLFLGKTLDIINKTKFRRTLETAFRKGYDEQFLIEEIVKLNYFPKPFSHYLLSPISISDFFDTHTDFQELKEHIDDLSLVDSISNLEKNINPVLSFKDDAVNIMSMHKSKGLQADYVFITGLNEGIIPNEARGIDTIEAQRRLLFVGMTRALKGLYMISTIEWEGKFVHKVDKAQFVYKHWKKKYHGKTSRFVKKMKK